MHASTRTQERHLIGWVLGLALAFGLVSSSLAGEPAPLQVQLTATGGARLVGDHARVVATVANTGSRPLRDVVLMLSLLDVSGSPAVPLGVEDWTPTPEAVHAASLAPGAHLTGTWRLRMIQAGRLAIFTTAVAGSSHSVANSRPVILEIGPTHNLTPGTVLPVAFGVPLVMLAGGGALLWRRRATGR